MLRKQTVRVDFVGLLTSYTDSILDVKLPLGLRFERAPVSELCQMYAEINQMHPFTARTQLGSMYHIMGIQGSPDPVVIRGAFDVETNGGTSRYSDLWNVSFAPSAERYNALLRSLKLMRLFTGSALDMPAHYWYVKVGNHYRPTMHGSGQPPLLGPQFSVSADELPALQSVLSHLKIPFGRPHLDQAVDVSELTTRAQRPSVAIALSMMGLVALLSQGQDSESWRMRTGPAALLATNSDDYTRIRDEMRRLYRIRCRALHDADPSAGTWEDVGSLRKLLARSILSAINVPGDKSALIKELDKRAESFGDRRTGVDPDTQ